VIIVPAGGGTGRQAGIRAPETISNQFQNNIHNIQRNQQEFNVQMWVISLKHQEFDEHRVSDLRYFCVLIQNLHLK